MVKNEGYFLNVSLRKASALNRMEPFTKARNAAGGFV
jgi:hypothetical protein